jgi:hypothetical protein
MTCRRGDRCREESIKYCAGSAQLTFVDIRPHAGQIDLIMPSDVVQALRVRVLTWERLPFLFSQTCCG